MNYLVVCPQLVGSKDEYYTFPVGLAYIKAALHEQFEAVYGLNLNWKDEPEKLLEEYIEKYDIDVLAVGGTSVEYLSIKNICNVAKKVKPSIVTIIGGGIVTASPEVTMRGIDNADFGIIGEGEYAICNLAKALEQGDSVTSIKSIVYRNDGQIVVNERDAEISNLDELPFPDYEGFDYQEILDAEVLSGITPSNQKHGYATICTSRSCPYKCTFCFHTCGNRYRTRSLDSVFAELDYLKEKYDFEFLDLVDELFTASEERVLEFCERIKPYGLKWTCSSRVDTITPRMLEAMKAAGAEMPVFGVESANNNILKSMKKNITIEKIESAFEMAKKAGLPATGNFLLGDVEETYESFQNTIKWFKEHPEYYIHFLKIRVLPGSEIYKIALEKGIIKDELAFYEAGFPFINVSKMTDEEYEKCYEMIHTAMREKLYMPEESRLISVDRANKKVTIEAVCRNCNETFEVIHGDISGSYIFQCTHCGQLHHMPIYEYMKEEIEEKTEQLITRGDIVIWGVGRVIEKLLFISEFLHRDKVYLVDKDENKQGTCVYGKTIENPEIIRNLNNPTVIIGATLESQYCQIKKQIEEGYTTRQIKTLAEFVFE